MLETASVQVDDRMQTRRRRPGKVADRQKVRAVYAGPQGALLATASFLSGHLTAAERLFRSRKFDLGGCRRILDVGTGAGQLAKPLVRYSDPQAQITCCDLSTNMLRRARARVSDVRPTFVLADVVRLPFANDSFDAVTCGFVLEHLPDATPGLAEVARVLSDGGRFFLLFMTDSFTSGWTRQLWRCRTFDRDEIFGVCQSLGLRWRQEFPVDLWQQMVRGNGVCVEMIKSSPSRS